jgi:hypothetical protein
VTTQPPTAPAKDEKPAPVKDEKTTVATDKPAEGSAGAGLTSIAMLVAPLIAALGGLALTGTIGRVQRDEPFWFSFAIGLVIASGVLWVMASTFTAPKTSDKRSTWDIVLRSIAFALAGAGFVIALVVAVTTANNESRPQVSATVSDDGTKLTTHVTASSLPSNDRLAFRIDLLKGGEPAGALYRAYVGPNSDGSVDQTITTLLPPGKYEEIGVQAYTGTTTPSCDDFALVRSESTFGSGTGCVILRVAPPAEKSESTKPAPQKP